MYIPHPPLQVYSRDATEITIHLTSLHLTLAIFTHQSKPEGSKMTATPPAHITLPRRQPPSDVFGGSSSPADSPSPSGPYSNRHLINRSLRPSFSTAGGRRKVSRATLRGLEDLGLDDEDESTKLPKLVPGIRPAYSTPLPVLPMVVLCIVSHIFEQC
jgi:hypothetical protein